MQRVKEVRYMAGADRKPEVKGSSRKQFFSESEMTKLKTRSRNRREAWLVILGIILHSVYMLSIFDIYFKTPIVHGVDPVAPRFAAPAKRLVLIVADGLRADKLFEHDTRGNPRAPFLRTVIEGKGRWGVSHARPPTESRPGHVSLIAGFYEDPSAVTKGWKANPVEFDSVFNRSKHTFAFGSPDVIPIFCGALPHCTFETYPPELEDFATDASFLDEWSFDRFRALLERSHENEKLKGLLSQENIVIFLHLFGCDSNGHAYRPHSAVYHNNVKVVDRIAERVYHLLESYYNDNRTSYIFTSDHGMSDKGSHGDGHPTNTETPLVVWGAGIKYPNLISSSNNSQTLENWNLRGLERMDVNQADIAPLMSTLLGLPIPVNSVGNLPIGYINVSKSEEVEALLSNTKQIVSQFLRKSEIKQSNALFFKPFKLPASPSSVLQQVDSFIVEENYESAMLLADNLKSLALEGLHYFQTYDWLMLMSVISLGYLGFIIYLLLHVLRFYSSTAESFPKKSETHKVYYFGSTLTAVISVVLLIEHSPPLYHAYFATTIFLWTQIFADFNAVKHTWRHFHQKKAEILVTIVMSVTVSEFLVHSFTKRELYTWCFVATGVIASYYLHKLIPFKTNLPIFVCLSCWAISPFTLMPAEIPNNNNLVIASGGIVIILAFFCRWIDVNYSTNKYIYSICCDEKKSSLKLFLLQASLVGASSAMVGIATSHRTENKELHPLHQIINWSISGISLILPLLSETTLLSRLNSIFLGFAPSFLLLSIGYEALFYAALAVLLVAWILFEIGCRTSNKDRLLQLSDARIPLTFMVLFNVAFFGTGNFASIASFEISSVYRFITIFSPFLMAALLIFKLFIPFMLVICAFSAVTKSMKIPRLGCYFIVILFSDLMTIHFFFLVRNTGSWMEIGNSISHFGIMSAQVIFVLLLFAITNVYTSHIRINSLSK